MMLIDLMENPLVLSIYEYGSIVYGTFIDGISDKDYIVIVEDVYPNIIDNIEHNNCHFNFYTVSRWKNMCEHNNVECLEVLFCASKHKLKEKFITDFEITPVDIRKSISKVVSNSYDKCRKKLTIEKDFAPRIAKKSLWHSWRILHYGIQVLKTGKIYNFSESNDVYDKIVNTPSNDWEYYKTEWHNKFLESRSEFRKLSENDWRKYKK